MFKQWFANLRNPAPALETDDIIEDVQNRFPLFLSDVGVSQKVKLEQLERRIRGLREVVAVMAKEKKEVSEFEFANQIQSLLKAQEAVAHQNMVASQNPAVTEILWNALRQEKAKTMFMVFGDVAGDPDEAEKQYSEYLQQVDQAEAK